MREQVVGPRVGNRSGVATRSRSSQQRPAKRDRAGAKESSGSGVRRLLGYVPLVIKLTLVVALGVLLFFGYQAAASASFFRLRNIEVKGTSHASVDAVQAIIRRDVAATGVWSADLKEIQ